MRGVEQTVNMEVALVCLPHRQDLILLIEAIIIIFGIHIGEESADVLLTLLEAGQQ